MLNLTRHDAVSVLELNRPEKRNALDLALARELSASATAEVAAGARVLVLTGAGSAFCSGADLDGVYGEEFLDALYRLLHGLAALPVPIVAAVNGPAIGAGTQLVLASDLVLAERGASFGIPTGRNGLGVDAWTIRTLSATVGLGRAKRLLIGAEVIDADTALDYGLVQRIGGLDAALAWADEVATLAPLSLAHNKAVLNGADDEEAARSFAAIWSSDDAEEYARSRRERRAPVFRGR